MHKLEVVEIQNDLLKVSFLNYGATVYKLEVLEDSKFVNKVLTFDSLDDYIDNGIYLNAICGPSAGRIANGMYESNGVVELSKNAGDHHLHGGMDSYARKYFDYTVSGNSVSFTLKTDNKEYPGVQDIRITYSLNGTDLAIDFEATTDGDIPMNITSHIYFNAFGSDTVFDNYLKVNSNERMILTNQAPIGCYKDESYLELSKITELDDPFILNGDLEAVKYVSGKDVLEVETDYDCVVIYTQNYASPEIDGVHKGICFETQKWPNGVNIEGYDALLKKGELYKHRTVYKFK